MPSGGVDRHIQLMQEMQVESLAVLSGVSLHTALMQAQAYGVSIHFSRRRLRMKPTFLLLRPLVMSSAQPHMTQMSWDGILCPSRMA